MDRRTWTEADQAWAHRDAYAERMGWFEVIRPARYRETNLRASALPTRGKHAAPEPDDEEPSQEGVTVSVVFYERQRSRPTNLQLAVLGGLGLAVMAVGIIAVRSLMGAS